MTISGQRSSQATKSQIQEGNMNMNIKRVYEQSKDDGVRIFVDRLWPRGLTKERPTSIYGLRRSLRARNSGNGLGMTRTGGKASAAAMKLRSGATMI